MIKVRSVLAFGLGLIAAGAAMVGWLEMMQIRELRTALEKSNQLGKHLAADVTADAKRNEWQRKQRAALQAKMDQLKAAHPEAARANERPLDEKAWLAIYGDPKLQNLRLNTYRSRLIFSYGGFYRAMGLSAAQIAKFEEIRAQSRAHYEDIAMAGETLGFDAKGPEVAPLIADNEARLRADELTLLGQAGYDRLQAYDQAAPERQFMSSLASNLLFTSAPLSSQQSEQLAQIVSATRQPAPLSAAEPMAPSGIDFGEVQAQAANFLSPAQVTELSSTIAEAKHRELMFQVMGMIRDWEHKSAWPGTH